MAYVRTVKTASGARAVQIVHSSRRGSWDIEHIGSAHEIFAVHTTKPQLNSQHPTQDQRS
ncbi:hypothetical protein [Amycolatopsis australiensis]|uniref:hypothetical protein n=1 Tax=Amycolatopsis australiensis TaxID=546364 RepID=UPI0009305CFD|nr:hypothetical protein [Amycolatopsis australiensis]